MKQLKWFFNNIEVILVVILILVMMVFLFLQVLFRYIFNAPLAWTEEMSMFCLVSLCYFGASMAITYRRHMRVTMLTNCFSPKVRHIFEIFANLVFLLFAVIIVSQNFLLTERIFKFGQLTAATRIPKWIPYTGIPVAFGLIIIRLMQDTYKLLRECLTIGQKIARDDVVDRPERGC